MFLNHKIKCYSLYEENNFNFIGCIINQLFSRRQNRIINYCTRFPPSKQWNQPVLNMEDSVKSLLQARQVTGFDEVRVALMEFTEPSVATVVKEMENKGITKIYALPLFIAPSGHSVYDIPSILGLYYNKNRRMP